MLANKQRMTYRELEIMKRSDRHGKPRAHRGIDWFDRGRTTRHVTVAVTAALLQDAAGMQLDSADNVEREFQADSTLMAHRQRRRVLDLEPMIDAERTVVRTEPLRDDALATERAGVAGIYNRATYANETRIALMSRHSVNSRRARFARFSSMPCSRSDRVARTVSDTVPG